MPEHTFSSPSSIQTKIYANMKIYNISRRQLPNHRTTPIFPRPHHSNPSPNYNDHRLRVYRHHFFTVFQQPPPGKPRNRKNLNINPSPSTDRHRHTLNESPVLDRRHQKRKICCKNNGTPMILKIRTQPHRRRRRLIHGKKKNVAITKML